MIALESTQPLFDATAPFTREMFVSPVVQHMRKTVLAGVPESHVEVTSQEGSPSDIIVKKVDPYAATGYRAFQSVQDYNSWLQASLYEPTQDEIEEALNRGNGS